MHAKTSMNLLSLSKASLPLIVAIAACSVSPTPNPNPHGDGSHEQAKSGLPRQPASEVSAGTLASAVAANNAFAVDLFAHVRTDIGKTPGNLLTSPLSASIALTMTYAGAKTQTATEMASALHFSSGAPTIFEGQNALTQALDGRAAAALAGDQERAKVNNLPAPSASNYQLQVVNSVWGERTVPWEPPFLDVLATYYGTGIELVDFINKFESARVTINDWVSAKTADKINNFLPVEAVTTSTRMVLVNAIHLKLGWMSPFTESMTENGTFTTSAGKPFQTPFMNQTADFSYVDDGLAQIVALPLAGNQLSVIFALPHGDLATYEAGLTGNSAGLAKPPTESMVSLSLPKVTFTSPTFSLKQSLENMGMKQAFVDGADFSGLCTTEQLAISDVLQKTMVAMDEKGVAAAAATAVIVSGSSSGGGPGPVPMVVDRPFVISIVDIPTGAILFLGHIEDPSGVGSL